MPDKAPTMPAMVGIVALDTPPAMDFASPPPVRAITKKTSIIPVTVPSRPSSGQTTTRDSIIGKVERRSREISEIIMLRICLALQELRSDLAFHTPSALRTRFAWVEFRYQILSKINENLTNSSAAMTQSTPPPLAMKALIASSASIRAKYMIENPRRPTPWWLIELRLFLR